MGRKLFVPSVTKRAINHIKTYKELNMGGLISCPWKEKCFLSSEAWWKTDDCSRFSMQAFFSHLHRGSHATVQTKVCISVVLHPITDPWLSQPMSLLRLSGQQEPEFMRRSGGVRGHGQARHHDSADRAAQRGESPLLLQLRQLVVELSSALRDDTLSDFANQTILIDLLPVAFQVTAVLLFCLCSPLCQIVVFLSVLFRFRMHVGTEKWSEEQGGWRGQRSCEPPVEFVVRFFPSPSIRWKNGTDEPEGSQACQLEATQPF